MDLSNWLVLVAEDEEDSAQVVSQILEHYGIQVYVARNGKKCLEALRETSPTLIVLDLAMPEMDGWQTLAAIRANPATAGIPVVAITAYDSFNVAEEAHQAGFDGYFSKPLQVASFIDALQTIVSNP